MPKTLATTQGKRSLTFFLRQILSRKPFELDARFHQQGVVVYHHLEVILVEGVLNVVTHVVQPTSSHVPACAFQLVGPLLHLGPVALVEAFSDLAHAHGQGHHLEALEHRNEEGLLTTEIFDRGDEVDWLSHVEVNDANDHTLWSS